MTTKALGIGVRTAATAVILTEVWLHAHWSVSLVLTLLAIANEVNGWLILNNGNQIRELRKYVVVANDLVETVLKKATTE